MQEIWLAFMGENLYMFGNTYEELVEGLKKMDMLPNDKFLKIKKFVEVGATGNYPEPNIGFLTEM